MNPPIAWMFSGQGSQYYEMGSELYAREPVFRRWVADGSALVESLTGFSIAEIVYHRNAQANRFDPFDRTLHTHPALFIVQFALDRLLRQRGHRPDLVIGYSLGEFVAYAVAGILSWDDALRAVVKHAQLLERMASPGRMLAVLSSPGIFREYQPRFSGIEIAAVNSDKHFVVTGSVKEIESLHQALHERNINSVVLPVQMAFHSAAVDAIEFEFKAFLRSLPLSRLQTPVVSAERGEILSAVEPESFWNVTRNSINFQRMIALLEARGPCLYVDLGPSGTLAGFVRQNLGRATESETLTILSPFGQNLRNLSLVESRLHRQ